MKMNIASATLICLGLALSACNRDGKNSTTASIDIGGDKATVEITDPWCRPTPNGAQAGACYLTVKSSADNTMTGVATPLAANAMVHDMSMAGGMMTMSDMTGGLPLKAGEKVELKPGGKHLMLTGLTGPLVEGAAVPLTLTFSNTPAMTVQAPVRQPK